MKKTPRVWLNDKEVNVLLDIAHRSKMECWFDNIMDITENGKKISVVFNAETKKNITLYNGVKWLQEGMSSYKNYLLNKDEIKTFEGILDKLGLPKLIK